MAAHAQISGPARLLLRAVAACLLVLIAALLLTPEGTGLHRWGVTVAAALATGATAARAVAIERDRRAWIPLALGLGAYTAGSLLWAVLYSGRADPPIPSAADILLLAFYPAAYATIAMVLRRSF